MNRSRSAQRDRRQRDVVYQNEEGSPLFIPDRQGPLRQQLSAQGSPASRATLVPAEPRGGGSKMGHVRGVARAAH